MALLPATALGGFGACSLDPGRQMGDAVGQVFDLRLEVQLLDLLREGL